MEPGGLWDAKQMEIVARWLDQDVVVAEVPLVYAGQPSLFSARLTRPERAGLRLEVLASDPTHINFGRDEIRFEALHP